MFNSRSILKIFISAMLINIYFSPIKASAESRVISPVYEEGVEISIRKAMKMHKRMYNLRNCFKFYIEVDSSNVIISIFPKSINMNGDKILIVSSGLHNECGGSFSYFFDKSGNFQKKVGVR